MVRIGLVGAGFMATTHVYRYRRMDDVTVSAVISPNTADRFVEEHDLDARAFADPEACIEATEVDAIDVCSPTHTHRSVVETAIERGFDVFCEKPLATSLADAAAIASAVDEHDATVMVGHVLRFFPAYRRIREEVAAGATGDLGTLRARRSSPFPTWGRDDWFADDERSGGVFLDLAIHEFDYLRWLAGDVERVFAHRTRWDDRQNGHATLAFESGAVGYVEAGWDRVPEAGLRSELEVAGDEALIEYDSTEPAPLVVETESEGDPQAVETVEKDGFQRELEAFVDCVRGDDTPPVTVDDAVEAMRISIAANRSAERGEPVAVAEVTA